MIDDYGNNYNFNAVISCPIDNSAIVVQIGVH
jgi:hypothetical protein